MPARRAARRSMYSRSHPYGGQRLSGVEYLLLAGPEGLLDRVETRGYRGKRPASPGSLYVGDKGHVGEPCPGRLQVRSATHSRLGAGGPKRRWTRPAGRAVAGSAIVVLAGLCRGWSDCARVWSTAVRRCIWPPRMPSRFRVSHFAGTVNTVVGGVDAADVPLSLPSRSSRRLGSRLMWS